jgi:hypothetical protein
MLIVRLEGLRPGRRGERKGETGAELAAALALGPVGTLRLRFLAFRGRLGGDGERWDALDGSSGEDALVRGETGVHSEYELGSSYIVE